MDKYLVIEMPQFHPEYRKWQKYGYRQKKEKQNLYNVLEKSTRGYCMYCYTRICIDGKMYGNLEHAIEKSNSDKLVECIPNIGLSCGICNQSLKKVGEKRRKIANDAVAAFERNSLCTKEKRKQCTKPCKALKDLQKKYMEARDARIILQPMGVTGTNGEELRIQFDVLKMQYLPAISYHTYSREDIEFIESHIKRFKLNESRPIQLGDFIKIVIDAGGKLPDYEYNNWIVNYFRDLLEHKPENEILKICEHLYPIVFYVVKQSCIL